MLRPTSIGSEGRGERGGKRPIYEGKERRGRGLLLRETGGRKERREGMEKEGEGIPPPKSR